MFRKRAPRIRGAQNDCVRPRQPASVATALGLLARLRDVMAEGRENRRKLETELFRNRYHHTSKNDDDLPIVR